MINVFCQQNKTIKFLHSKIRFITVYAGYLNKFENVITKTDYYYFERQYVMTLLTIILKMTQLEINKTKAENNHRYPPKLLISGQ